MSEEEKKKFPRLKVTNRSQFECLIEFMEKNPHFSKGMKYAITNHAISRLEFSNAWDELTERLNDLGPPNRTTVEWQKVWIDYKLKNKQRYLRNVVKYGGDTNKFSKTTAEKRLAQILDLNPKDADPLASKTTKKIKRTTVVSPNGNVYKIKKNNAAESVKNLFESVTVITKQSSPATHSDSVESNDENEFQLFGKYIAKQLENLPLEAAFDAQEQIQKILTTKRLALQQSKQKSRSSPLLMDATTDDDDQEFGSSEMIFKKEKTEFNV